MQFRTPPHLPTHVYTNIYTYIRRRIYIDYIYIYSTLHTPDTKKHIHQRQPTDMHRHSHAYKQRFKQNPTYTHPYKYTGRPTHPSILTHPYTDTSRHKYTRTETISSILLLNINNSGNIIQQQTGLAWPADKSQTFAPGL